MKLCVGVDVGGTFTKAVAVDPATGAIAAQAVLPTTHDHDHGVAAGVVEVVSQVAGAVGADEVALVTHSTTQAVNALLEGDAATVGVIGLGRAPDLRKTQRRTTVDDLELSPGRKLATISEFLDVTNGLDEDAVRAALRRIVAGGGTAVAVAEAFAPDDESNERRVAALAAAAGLPVTTSSELSGLYGLELRAVTAALNASILPIAARTAEVVSEGVHEVGVAAPVMVMRGDGGATDLDGFRAAPARTLYSGPAASVAGALRTSRIDDGVIVEIGGTSTNVAAIRRGRPALSYVQVASHATAIRALDVRVVGVAGGSMLRARRGKVYGVGPRSAHIAGLRYACYLDPADLEGATAELIAPRPGDAADHLVVRRSDGERVALTNTCAANALDMVEADDYAAGSGEAARLGFAAAGAVLRLDADEVARRMLQASTQHIGDLIASVMKSHALEQPTLIAVGGGAGGLGRAIGRAMGLDTVVPPHAEVISAVGDALSLIRVERERTLDPRDDALVSQLMADAEAEAVAAGAGAASLDVRVEAIPDRGAVRVVVSGSVELAAGVLPGREPATPDQVAAAATARGYHAPVRTVGAFWVATDRAAGRVAVLDRYGDVVVDIAGEAVELTDRTAAEVDLAAVVARRTKRVGPVAVDPDAWMLYRNRAMQLPDSDPATIHAAHATARTDVLVVIGRD